jgi:hypothetical protein
MDTSLFSSQIDNYLYNLNLLSVGIAFVGVTYYMLISYAVSYHDNMVRPIDASRVEEGLPTDMTLTAEDYINNPELAEIFGEIDINNGLDLILESHEHVLNTANPIIAFNYRIIGFLMRINGDINYLINFSNEDQYGNILIPISEIMVRYYTTIGTFISSFF